MWTVLVAGILSLAIVGVRPGARNWLAKAFSVGDACGWLWVELLWTAIYINKLNVGRGLKISNLTSFSASKSPFRKSTFLVYSVRISCVGLLQKDTNTEAAERFYNKTPAVSAVTSVQINRECSSSKKENILGPDCVY